MDQRRVVTDVGGWNETSNMRSNDQRRYRVIADKDTTPDLVSTHAAPGDRLVYDVIDADRWSLVRVERPVEGAVLSVQPPSREQIAELRGRVVDAIINVRDKYPRDSRDADSEEVADAVLALFPQPTPSAECTCGYGGVHEPMNPRCERNGYRWTEPPSIADMVPGTTFGDGQHRYTVEPVLLREVRREDGQKFYADEIDPSTIRDVTPPPTTPEGGS